MVQTVTYKMGVVQGVALGLVLAGVAVGFANGTKAADWLDNVLTGTGALLMAGNAVLLWSRNRQARKEAT